MGICRCRWSHWGCSNASNGEQLQYRWSFAPPLPHSYQAMDWYQLGTPALGSLLCFCPVLCSSFPESALFLKSPTSPLVSTDGWFGLQMDVGNPCYLQIRTHTCMDPEVRSSGAWCSVCGPWTSGMGITWEYVRISEPPAAPSPSDTESAF